MVGTFLEILLSHNLNNILTVLNMWITTKTHYLPKINSLAPSIQFIKQLTITKPLLLNLNSSSSHQVKLPDKALNPQTLPKSCSVDQDLNLDCDDREDLGFEEGDIYEEGEVEGSIYVAKINHTYLCIPT